MTAAIIVNGVTYDSVREAHRETYVPLKRLYAAARKGEEYRGPVNQHSKPMTPNRLYCAFAQAQPGDKIVYHEGPAGSAPNTIKQAANNLTDALLFQRFSGRMQGNDRIFQYIVVKKEPVK